MRLTPAEYCMLLLLTLLLAIKLIFHLPYALPNDLIKGGIHWLLLFFSIEIVAFPLVLLLIKSIFHQLHVLKVLIRTKEFIPVQVTIHQGLLKEWTAAKMGLQLLRDWFPLIVFMGTYWLFPYLAVKLSIPSQDELLAKWDLLIFKTHLSVLSERFYNPTLTALLNFSYFMHVIIIPLTLCLTYLTKKHLFQRSLLFIFIVDFFGAIGYILLPAYGPYVYLRNFYHVRLTHPALIAFMDISKAYRDAFPSLHIAISSGLLIYQYRYAKWLFWLLLPLVIGNWISTIYLRYHYTVDLLAGFAVAGIAYVITEVSFKLWEKS